MAEIILGSPLDRIPAREGSSEYLDALRMFDESGHKFIEVRYLTDEQTPKSVCSGFRMIQRKYGYKHIKVIQRGPNVYLHNTSVE